MSLQADERTLFPPTDLAPLEELASAVGTAHGPALLVAPNGQTVPIPAEVYEALVQVVDAMLNGRAITLAPQAQRLTTQQAADALGISRPTLIKLLESGEIEFEKPGKHRRVRLADVIAYRDRLAVRRRRALDEMTQSAVEDGLYEATVGDYSAALKDARRQRSSNA